MPVQKPEQRVKEGLTTRHSLEVLGRRKAVRRKIRARQMEAAWGGGNDLEQLADSHRARL